MTDIRAVAARAEALEAEVGHPGERWDELKRRVQDEAITQFRQVEADWLSLMWAIDAYRVAGVPPRAMGRISVESAARLGAIYRSKGNCVADHGNSPPSIIETPQVSTRVGRTSA